MLFELLILYGRMVVISCFSYRNDVHPDAEYVQVRNESCVYLGLGHAYSTVPCVVFFSST